MKICRLPHGDGSVGSYSGGMTTLIAMDRLSSPSQPLEARAES